MIIFFLALIVFLLSIFQLTLAPKILFLGITPDFILAGVISLAITARNPVFKWLVLGWAFFFDLLAGQPFGILTLSFFAVFFFINWLANSWLKQSGFWAVLFLGIMGIVFFDLIVFLCQKIAAVFFAVPFRPSEFPEVLFNMSAGVLYNILIFLAIFYLLEKFKFFFRRFQR